MELCVLGSGSGGNCTAVRIGGRVLLIDAGFGPRSVARRLAGVGAALGEVRAVLLTHLDHDHFNPRWLAALHRFRIPVYCHERHIHALYRHRPMTREAVDAAVLHRAGLLHRFDDGPFALPLADAVGLTSRDREGAVLPAGVNGSASAEMRGGAAPTAPLRSRLVSEAPHDGHADRGDGGNGSAAVGCTLRIAPLPFAHDRAGTVGFRVTAATGRLGYATDLGRVPAKLIEAFAGVDLLAIESNYDPPMQLASGRPAALKRRIMGGRGHLSNEQAFEAVRRIVDRSGRPPRHIVLLHLSRQCNAPPIARAAFTGAPHLAARLCLSNQRLPTPWLTTAGEHRPLPGEQLTMFA